MFKNKAGEGFNSVDEYVDELEARIESARLHLKHTFEVQSRMGTEAFWDVQRALELLDGEPDGADG